MGRTVMCRKFGGELPGLEKPPFPGPAGQDIYEHVSAQAWAAWIELQTMLINENQINTMDAEGRKWLAEQRSAFFRNEDHARPSGYVPPEQAD
ncbi:MAG: oxidative damage protection protein [Gammaproteobacteria bacterium AqS3]|nr:oxidative damage protection protein [Gammaproteobacteria bacterium AqS3]